MIGVRLGPYRIAAEIGSGGMGVVYRATAEGGASVPVGTPVAVKVIHPRLADDPVHVERFLREADFGRRIVHENVVRTLDVGTTDVDGRLVRWLAMELVEGRTLRRLLDDLHRVPEALLREVGRETANALAAIHALGIVHRDVKPENLVLTPDHRVRLMDLGIARLLEGGDALTRTGAFAGSLLYTSPEQVRGDEPGPSSDLYALGLVLYELAAGKHPFAGRNVASILEAQLRQVPERLDSVDPERSPFLTELIVRLTDKDPAARPASGAALAQILDEGEHGAWWKERAARGALPEPVPRIPVPREAPFVGREDEMQALRAWLAEARAGAGRAVLVEGEPGIGKSRLCDQLVSEVAPRDARALYGATAAGGGTQAFSSALLSALGEDGIEATLRRRLGLPAPLAAAFSAHLRREAPPAGVEVLRGDALVAAYVQAAAALAADRPLVWVIDDFHHAGLEAWALLKGLVRSLPGTRALLLVAARPGLSEEGVAALESTGSLRRLSLPRFRRDSVRALLASAIGSRAVAERLADDVAARSDGVPLFALEIARQLRDTGTVRVATDGTIAGVDLSRALQVPRVVRDVVLARLRDVRREERDLLDASAIQGFEFDPDLTARQLDSRRVRVLQDLADLERRTGLVRANGRGFRFDHHQVMETLLEELPDALREEYHALAAEAIAERAGADASKPDTVPDDTAAALVQQALLGSRPGLALPWLDRVLAHLDGAGRVAEGLDACRRALAVKGLLDDARRLDVLLKGQRFLEMCGRKDGIDELLAEAVAVSDRMRTPGPRARARSMLGRSLWVRGQFPDALAPLQEALPLARESGDRALEASVERGLGLLAVSTSRVGDAEAHFERYLALARDLGDASGEAMGLANLGLVADKRGRRDLARERYEAAQAIAERIGARRTAATIFGNLALIDQGEGRLGDAETALRRHVDLAREVAERPQAAYAYVNLGFVLHMQGAHEEARAALESALVETQATGMRRVEGYARDRLGLVHDSLGDESGARLAHEEALALRREIQYPSGIVDSLQHLARLDARRGDLTSALRRIEEATALAKEHGLSAAEVVLAAERVAYRIPGPDGAAAALDLFDRHGHILDATERLHVLVLLATALDRDDLRAAARVLSDRLVAAATPARRASMVERLEDHRLARGD